MNANFLIICGALLNSLGVGLGAFGAHFLKSRLMAQDLITYETSVRYLLIHATALIILDLLNTRLGNPGVKLIGGLFIAGIIFFSGSLFLLIATKVRFFGAITPVGGLCFILGWLALAWSARGSSRRPAS